MAIIYSYPKTNQLNGSDLLMLSRFNTEASQENGRTYSLDIDTLGSYIRNNYGSALNEVLEEGNVSILDTYLSLIHI